MKKKTTLLSTLGGCVMIFCLWQLLSLAVNRPILPSPVQVVPLFVVNMTGELGLHFLASTARVLAAVLVATVFAAPLGLALGQLPRLDRVISPLIAIIYPIPKIIFLPVIYVLMGITDLSKITLIAIIIFFQILVVVRDEAAGLRQELILSVKSLGAGRRALFKYVYLPASLPAVLTALRVSVGTAVAVLFIAEQSLTSYGLGYYIVIETYQVLLYPEMYTGIMGMGLLGVLLYFSIYSIELKVGKHLFIE
ncbi:ABC transporter permease [Desulforhopalus singaporensis]|uniref:NitT/TauT family transport system permease protein n=1 Tax=Desulforhopalus singaporensis TaxID=91360 RepID=A0A1H0KQ45_9BACT|nr:ABC transporter permease subunit [Desulforhopalus singaporensis]SDO57985.1 NitT/TauT family transport system permease protein [Desulforhopalus singaporensis]